MLHDAVAANDAVAAKCHNIDFHLLCATASLKIKRSQNK